ncbi:MAG TPA: DUF1761 domain-containing protein [Gemmatimonadaceae bacterium]|nr:DUF1761 domain-containing protein [Gemmatimonadaceae bacterium]
MSYSRLALATLGATIVYFASGFLFMGTLFRDEFRRYPALYRSAEGMKSVMPIGLVSTFVGIWVVAVLYAMIHPGGSGVGDGARFGALIGLFAVCGFVLHNYVNLNIGLKLTLQQAVGYFVEWLLVGIVIALLYRPVSA